jgi:integrase/recombinase XerD
VIESAKERRTGIYRAIPIPPALLDMLNLVHDVRNAQKRRDRGKTVRLWDWVGRRAGTSSVSHEGRQDSGAHATPGARM